MRYAVVISWFLGISMFMVGFLKFFDPFKTWYTMQIATSGLGDISYVMGIAGELIVGCLFILPSLLEGYLSSKTINWSHGIASSLVIAIMMVGVYVHSHPAVPADVLPLKIKPPYIPVFFMIVSIINLIVRSRLMKRA